MKYTIYKEAHVYQGKRMIVYLVEPSNPILRWVCHFFLGDYEPFFNLDEAKQCLELKMKGKWTYSEKLGVVNYR